MNSGSPPGGYTPFWRSGRVEAARTCVMLDVQAQEHGESQLEPPSRPRGMAAARRLDDVHPNVIPYCSARLWGMRIPTHNRATFGRNINTEQHSNPTSEHARAARVRREGPSRAS
eukprot:8744473-Pyramimonas_sp.AAC.1